eukprot:gene69140-94764_t
MVILLSTSEISAACQMVATLRILSGSSFCANPMTSGCSSRVTAEFKERRRTRCTPVGRASRIYSCAGISEDA